MTRRRIFVRLALTLWFLLLQSWKIGGYRKYLRDRVTPTRGGGARCAVRSCRTCAITITCISRESTPARSVLRFTRVATRCSRTRVPSTRTRNSARVRAGNCGSSATILYNRSYSKGSSYHPKWYLHIIARLHVFSRFRISFQIFERCSCFLIICILERFWLISWSSWLKMSGMIFHQKQVVA